jgi:hypothetical protein
MLLQEAAEVLTQASLKLTESPISFWGGVRIACFQESALFFGLACSFANLAWE